MAPASTLAVLRARINSKFAGADPRVCIAFWLFGLINNIFYVIILSAALDLVGPAIPKATVLLACIVPGLATKSVAPYVIQYISHAHRVILFTLLSTCGMLAVALSPDSTDAAALSSKIAGIVLANISSGAGEVSFLGLVHYYGPFSLAAWGSGTGGAGLVGASAYALATNQLGFSVHGTLMASALLSVFMLLSFFVLLPQGPLRTSAQDPFSRRFSADVEAEDDEYNNINTNDAPAESSGLLQQPPHRAVSPAYLRQRSSTSLYNDIRTKILRARTLIIPYMIPLFLVYLAEYTINQGVAPTLLFPLRDSPFDRYRAFYPVYAAIYQSGVFLSRSSLPFLCIRSLYVPTFLQVLNLALLIAQALWAFLPNVWFVFLIIFWEGLLGGLVYVSTFAAIREEVPAPEREFSLGAATVSDSAGIFFASLLGVTLETALCKWQVQRDRGWCMRL